MGKDDIREETRKWISSQGFHLEMKVAKKFYDNGFEVTSSHIYEDPFTKIGREIDIIATKGTFLDKHIIFDITFIIECKYSKDKPWVLFKSSQQDHRDIKYNFVFRNASEYGQIILLELENFKNQLKNNFLLSLNDIHYGIKRALAKKGDNMTYEAINQVCNATYARGREINNFNKSYITTFEIQFPVIVVEGILFESYLNKKLDVVVKEIDYGRLLVSKPELGNEKFFIDIVSFNFLDKYINLISEAAETLLSYSGKLEKTKKIINKKNRA